MATRPRYLLCRSDFTRGEIRAEAGLALLPITQHSLTTDYLNKPENRSILL